MRRCAKIYQYSERSDEIGKAENTIAVGRIEEEVFEIFLFEIKIDSSKKILYSLLELAEICNAGACVEEIIVGLGLSHKKHYIVEIASF